MWGSGPRHSDGRLACHGSGGGPATGTFLGGGRWCTSAGMKVPQSGALVLFSGGQDSTVCLAWALARFPWVETVGFDYGQRHAAELEARTAVRAALLDAFPH